MRVETKSVEHLRDIHRIGATCANLDGERLILWGGTIEDKDGTAEELNAKRADVWIYDTLTESWARKQCRYAPESNFKLPTLTGSTSSIIGKQMLVFGGHSAEDNWLNSLYSLDLDSFTWSDLGSAALAKPTKPIRSDKNASWAFNGKFYVFGGYGWSQTEHMPELMDRQKDLQLCPDHRWPKFGWNNQLVEYDPCTKTWTWPSYSGRCPSARAAHCGTLIDNLYYVFGGRDIHERLNDLYTLDMNTFEWRRLATIADSDLSPRNSVQRPPMRHLYDNDNDDHQDVQQHQQSDEQHNGGIEIGDDMVLDRVDHRVDMQQQRQLSRTSSVLSTRPSTSEYNDDELASGQSYLVERWSLSLNQSTSSATEPNSCSIFGFVDGSIEEVSDETSADIEAVIDQIVDRDVAINGADQVQHNQQQLINDLNPDEQLIVQKLLQPVGRSFASFTPISQDSILLYGGICSEEKNLDDCWTYSTKRNCWKQVELSCKRPRLWHAGLRSNENEVILLAGSSEKIDNFCTDVLILSSSPNSLKKLSMKAMASLVENRRLTSTALHTIPKSLRNIITSIYVRYQIKIIHVKNMTNQRVIDSASIQGQFGWEKVGAQSQDLSLPVILRDMIRYTPVRIAEQEIIKKFEDLPQLVFRCINLKSYFITKNEADLLNNINWFHCDYKYGEQSFSTMDIIITANDVKELSRFLNISHKIFSTGLADFANKLGVVEIIYQPSNSRTLVPYLCKILGNGRIVKFVPASLVGLNVQYSSEFTVKATATDWDLMHLKMLCVYCNNDQSNLMDNSRDLISLDGLLNTFDKSPIDYKTWDRTN